MVGRGATVGVTAVFVIALLCIYGNYLDSSTTSSAAWIKPTDQQAARKMTPLEAENDGNTLLFQQRLVHYEVRARAHPRRHARPCVCARPCVHLPFW